MIPTATEHEAPVGTGDTKGQSGLCPGELAVRRGFVCKPVVQSAEWPGSPGKPGGETSPGAMAGRLLGGDELELSGWALASKRGRRKGRRPGKEKPCQGTIWKPVFALTRERGER